MRPISQPQGALRAPLNAILGTEANVRLLRVLIAVGAPLSQTVLANTAGLNPSGAGRSLVALEELGIVEYSGTGARRLVTIRGAHPLVDALRDLFRAERVRFDSLADRLREVARHLPGPPKAVWIEGPVVTDTDAIGDPVGVGVLASSRELAEVMAALAEPVDIISAELDVTIEVRGLTVPDLEALSKAEMDRLSMVTPVLGPPPLLVAGRWKAVPKKLRSHADLDANALSQARGIADAIRADPGLVKRALAGIRERKGVASPGERKELDEWERVLTTMSLPRLRRFLVDPGERATRLRQSMPFAGIMKPHEAVDVVARSRSGSRKGRR